MVRCVCPLTKQRYGQSCTGGVQLTKGGLMAVGDCVAPVWSVWPGVRAPQLAVGLLIALAVICFLVWRQIRAGDRLEVR